VEAQLHLNGVANVATHSEHQIEYKATSNEVVSVGAYMCSVQNAAMGNISHGLNVSRGTGLEIFNPRNHSNYRPE